MAVERTPGTGNRNTVGDAESPGRRDGERQSQGIPSADGTPDSHSGCLLCGKDNPFSLGLRFKADGKGVVETEVTLTRRLQGYHGILHGGVISSLLDAAMAHSLFTVGIEAVTGDLRIRFLHEVPCRGKIALRSWVLASFPPLYSVRAEILFEGQLMAWGEGKFARRSGNS